MSIVKFYLHVAPVGGFIVVWSGTPVITTQACTIVISSSHLQFYNVPSFNVCYTVHNYSQTYLRVYLYITPQCHTSISHLYVTPLYHISISHLYITSLYQISISHLYIISLYHTSISYLYITSLYHISISHLYITSL
jgi:hypothetical protein